MKTSEEDEMPIMQVPFLDESEPSSEPVVTNFGVTFTRKMTRKEYEEYRVKLDYNCE